MLHRERNEPTAGFAVGILTGAVLGAGVALLLAPKSGAQLRTDINDSVGSLRDAVGQRYREMAARAGIQLDDLQQRIDRAMDAFETSAHDVVQSAANLARRSGRGA